MESSPESNPTVTQREQWTVENHVFAIYNHFTDLPDRAKSVMMELMRENHILYLTNGLRRLSPSFCVLDANRPWVCYWILHSLALLGEDIDEELENNAIDFLNLCQDPNGGYGGGPGQMPHLATTYAAVNSLITLGGHRSLSSINRDKLYTFLKRMKDASGCFRMHDQGEMDVRACYTAISVASILDILDNELVENVGDYILRCQTYEGGIAGEPGSEAHGGYTFCGLATMILINEAQRLDLPALINWVVFRQGVEGGFQGRTNKLVDGCYSFWQGGVFPLIQRLLPLINEQITMINVRNQDGSLGSLQSSTNSCSFESKRDERCGAGEGPVSGADTVNLSNIGLSFLKQDADRTPLFQSLALQHYILLCSQVLEGGLRDKPGKGRDFYHTCYCLSGLSVCQYMSSTNLHLSPPPRSVLGPYSNLLEPLHPLYNVVLDCYYDTQEYFSSARA